MPPILEHPDEVSVRFRSLIDLLSTSFLVAAAFFFIRDLHARKQIAAPAAAPRPAPSGPIQIGDLPTLGSPAAPISILIFSDFQCVFCRRFSDDVYPTIKSRLVNPGIASLRFIHDPNTQLHPQAKRLAVAAECGREQGHFWEMHDALFALPNEPSADDIAVAAQTAGLDHNAFASCQSANNTKRINSGRRLALDMAITGTPTFFVGRVTNPTQMIITDVIVGAAPYSRFASAVASASIK